LFPPVLRPGRQGTLRCALSSLRFLFDSSTLVRRLDFHRPLNEVRYVSRVGDVPPRPRARQFSLPRMAKTVRFFRLYSHTDEFAQLSFSRYFNRKGTQLAQRERDIAQPRQATSHPHIVTVRVC